MTQIGRISGGLHAWRGKPRTEKAHADVTGFVSTIAPVAKISEKNRERRKFSRGTLQTAASSPFLAQYLDQRHGAVTGACELADSARRGTLAYIGADMLPELLAETKKPRRFDGNL